MFFVYNDVLQDNSIDAYKSMRLNVSYNKYELNNPRKRQNIEKIIKINLKSDFVTHVT
jgi:hypothetical protein